MALNAALGGTVKAPAGQIRVPFSVAQAVMKDKNNIGAPVQPGHSLIGMGDILRANSNKSIGNIGASIHKPGWKVVTGYKIHNGDWTLNKVPVSNLVLQMDSKFQNIFLSVHGNTDEFLNWLVTNGFMSVVETCNLAWLIKAGFRKP